MALEDSILRFKEQFDWQPEIQHQEALQPHKNVIIVGMGGSHLGPWMLKRYVGGQNIFIHRDYGMPDLSEDVLKEALIILSSYSGDTEEVLDAGRVALEKGCSIAAISRGGKLIDFAREHALPHIVVPDMHMQPRVAIGVSMLGIAKLMMSDVMEKAVRTAGKSIDAAAGREEGMRLAEALRGKIPVIYASSANMPLSFIWKIKLNESGKIPAFYNSFPEMCHNELCGYDVAESTLPMTERLHAIMLSDAADHPRNVVRMRAVSDILREKSIGVSTVALSGDGLAKIFAGAVLADWVSLFLAAYYGVPDEQVPLVEDFKKRIG